LGDEREVLRERDRAYVDTLTRLLGGYARMPGENDGSRSEVDRLIGCGAVPRPLPGQGRFLEQGRGKGRGNDGEGAALRRGRAAVRAKGRGAEARRRRMAEGVRGTRNCRWKSLLRGACHSLMGLGMDLAGSSLASAAKASFGKPVAWRPRDRSFGGFADSASPPHSLVEVASPAAPPCASPWTRVAGAGLFAGWEHGQFRHKLAQKVF
jgi:hypothetical protein